MRGWWDEDDGGDYCCCREMEMGGALKWGRGLLISCRSMLLVSLSDVGSLLKDVKGHKRRASQSGKRGHEREGQEDARTPLNVQKLRSGFQFKCQVDQRTSRNKSSIAFPLFLSFFILFFLCAFSSSSPPSFVSVPVPFIIHSSCSCSPNPGFSASTSDSRVWKS